MTMLDFCRTLTLGLTVAVCFSSGIAIAQDKSDDKKENQTKPDPIAIKVSGGNILFSATGSWETVKPRSTMLEVELKIPRVGEDEQDGRLTIMGAGGSIDANIERWEDQFTPANEAEAAKNKIEKKVISDQTVHLVDLSGTFIDAPGGPFSGQPKVTRKGYRMLAAIVETEQSGNYFVKLYGPKATIEKNAEHFKAMINSLKVVE